MEGYVRLMLAITLSLAFIALGLLLKNGVR
jgi:hypothetical protein